LRLRGFAPLRFSSILKKKLLFGKFSRPIQDPIMKLYFLFLSATLFGSLSELELKVQNELRLMNYPPRQVERESRWEGVLDVAIIGPGMAGQTAAFALKREGVDQICLFDQAQEGEEGPWLTYARMKILQSVKTQMGPAYWVPSLTFESYYRARFDDLAWEELFKAPTRIWGEYIFWIRKVLNLPVKNGWNLQSIEPKENFFRLHFENGHEAMARKVVFANGREGMGGHNVPDLFKSLPKTCWSIANQRVDYDSLKGKRVGVIGASSSAYDAAIFAAETGAEKVVIFCRREEHAKRNKQRDLYFTSFYRDFYAMDEELHWDFVAHIYDSKMFPPPPETIAEFKKTHATIEMGISVLNATWDGEIILETSRGTFHFDHLINATGYYIDLNDCPLIAPFVHSIALWGDRKKDGDPRFVRFPYLGPHFEFQGDLPFLKDLYCFNYAAFMSHGTSVGDMPGISYGARRLAEGIAADLFLQEARRVYEMWKEKPLFDFSR
jgi:cation diffusion facilitator CzcD-associated flavoprotein CzcO